MSECPCSCHGSSSTFGSCSVNGGCGHLHTDEAAQRCARRDHCSDLRKRRETDPDGTVKTVRVPAWATTAGGLCRIDTQLARRAVEQLPADYAELGRLLGKTYGTLEPPTSGSRELPVPIRVNVEALQAAILDEVERWAVEVSDYEPCGNRFARVTAASVRLAGHFDTWLTLPATDQQRFDPTEQTLSGKDHTVFTVETGVDGALRILELHERVQAVAGRSQRAHRLWTPCPSCHRLALEHEDGMSHVDCKRCGERLPYDEYEELAGVLARAHGGAAA